MTTLQRTITRLAAENPEASFESLVRQADQLLHQAAEARRRKPCTICNATGEHAGVYCPWCSGTGTEP